MEVDRLKEEIELLKKEMLSFLNYYIHNVLPRLRKELEELKHIKGMISFLGWRNVFLAGCINQLGVLKQCCSQSN